MNDFSKREWKWILIGWALLRLVFYFGTGDLWAAQTDRIERDLSQKKKELKKIKKELNQKKVWEKEVRRKESSVLKRLHQVTAELQQKEKELKKMKAKANGIKRNLGQTRNKIVMLNQEIEQTREKLISRLNALYKIKRIPSEIFLFPSDSYSDLLKIDKYLRVIIDSDARLIDTYQHQVDLKERYQEDLIQDESQWLHSISKVEKKKGEIKKVRRTNHVLLKSIQNQKEVYQKVIGKLEESAKRLQDLIDKLGREKDLLAYGRPGNKTDKGKVLPPVQGRVISLFKEKGQNGVEIKASIGAPVRAILPGKVVYADWFKGFENLIIIDHGDGILTISGNCSKLIKKRGDTVSEGEIIARVGNSESDRAPSFYFEIRHRGKPQDPLEWISNYKKSPKRTGLE